MYHARTFFSEFRESPTGIKILFFTSVFSVCVALGLSFSLLFAIERNVLAVSFLDVGQGDAIYIESPNGTDILIDGGLTRSVLRERAKLEPFWDRDIDLVVATHPDADHIGGLVDVLERLQVDVIGVSGATSDTETAQAFEREAGEEDAYIETLERGERIVIDESVFFTVLAPVEVNETSETNDASVVMRLDYGETSFLFTGDISIDIENELLKSPTEVDTDILKVGHHGSATSTSLDFARAVSPAAAVISVGENNRYGHPSSRVLNTLSNLGIDTFRTDEGGTITFVSDGSDIVRKGIGFFQYIF